MSPTNSEQPQEGRRMFSRGFLERRDLEQYFWTDKTIESILSALRFTFEPEARCCLCTPTLADVSWTRDGEEVNLLDIDTRFNYLPKFRYFDLRYPQLTDLAPDQEYWRVIVFDPPFFYISLNLLLEAVRYVCSGNVSSTKLLLGFLKREERNLLEVFKEFNLKRTTFPLEYSHVKPNKWINYALYSNIDMPGIKRLHVN
ncbi:hypothetical protein Fcan01_07460 [Folsomia candida]|uniref:N(6)-adenine-specific DNA methyltransferase 2 n=1 Tax=Folsomia candida TaxID=158441 RepID=A0A226ENU7_FOLCA|nr:hypothetical protein Fcan01_07460 [Folsomia candida]